MDKIRRTQEVYNLMWNKGSAGILYESGHLHKMQSVIPESIVSGALGIDIGSGLGYDTYVMAKDNPAVKIVSLDLSDGIYKTKELVNELNNVLVIKGSVMSLPVKSGVFDFAYSFGVLHHTPDPKKCLSEIARILKKESPVFLYLYEDHSENVIKYVAVKIIRALRKVTIEIPPRLLYVLCSLFSPFVFLIFSLPAKILMKFNVTRNLAKVMPFNFGRSPFSLGPDLYDRFSTPIEHRFSRREVYDILMRSGFYNIHITRLKISAGWVVWGYRK